MVWYFIGVYTIIEYYMVAWRYEISFLVLKTIFHLFAALTREIFFNTWRQISYLCAVMQRSRTHLNFPKSILHRENKLNLATNLVY